MTATVSKIEEHWGGLSKAERDERRKHPQTLGDHEARLEEGWVWLKEHPNHRGADDAFAIWETWIEAYTAACRAAGIGVQVEMAL